MINKIKLYEVSVKRGFNGAKTYTKKDITKQMEIPFNDTCQRDGVLDTSSISILRKDKTPLKPLTRIIIELYDDKDNGAITEKIYRVVDVDNVSNAVRGNIPLYRHSIMLIELTKILERRSCDNLSFTNYLTSSLGTDYRVDNQLDEGYVDGANGLGNISGRRILASERTDVGTSPLLGPYHILGENDTILTDFGVNIKFQYDWAILGIATGKSSTVSMGLDRFYVETPSGRQELSRSGTFTYKEEGKYKFVQKYRYWSQQIMEGNDSVVSTVISHDAIQEIYWEIKCVKTLPLIIHTYTIKQAIERLLSIHRVLRSSIDSAEFHLDYSLVKKLEVPAPEFTITEGTLFEALTQIGNYIHAIPRLVPDVRGDDDYSNWNKITFDFLDAGTEIEKGTYSLIDMENPTEEYAESFVSNVQNATTVNYSGKATQVEPFEGGYLSARTESSMFEISDKDCIFKTKEKIRTLIKAILLVNGETIDITNNIVEESKYKLKSQYKDGNSIDLKCFYLYYKEGSNNIYGLSFVPTTKSEQHTFVITEAIKNIVKVKTTNNELLSNIDKIGIKDIAINIEYIPWVNFKTRQYKTHLDDSVEQSTLYYNQQANEVDIDAYGENMHYALVRTGNVKLSKTQYFYSLKNIPKCGDYFIEDGSKWVAFQINRELSFGAPIKVTIAWAKDYNELYAEIAVKKALRQFEIAEKGIHNRNIDIQEFCIVGTEPDYKYEQTSFTKLGFGRALHAEKICSHLNGNARERMVYVAACKTFTKSDTVGAAYISKSFFVPVGVHAFGRSVVFHFSLDDNYSAGTYANNSFVENNTYAIEEYIPYCDEYGRAEFFSFGLAENIKEDINNKNTSHTYYTLTDAELKGTFANACALWGSSDESLNNASIVLNKDSREAISVTTQLNFVSFERNIEIYKAFVDTMPYLADSATTYRVVIFKKRQAKTSEKIQGEYTSLGKINANVIADLSTIKINIPTATTSGVGYGIITDDERLCVYVEENIWTNKTLKPIYLMYRNKI